MKMRPRFEVLLGFCMESFGERKVLGGISSRVYTLYRGGGGC